MNQPSTLTDAQLWNSELTMSIAVTIFIGVVTVLVVVFFGIWKFRAKASPSHAETTRKYRFRKRDKIVFFGRKMLRKVKSFTRNTVGPSGAGGLRRKPSKLMISRLRSRVELEEEDRFLAERRESNKPRLKQQSPPQSFLEADWSDIGEDHRLPPEVLYMLRSVRVFGHLEKPFFLELCRFMETITLRSGNYLFKIGDPDDSIFVVQNGLLEVFITDADGTEHLVKEVATGNSIHSLLSILDVLTGHPGSFRSVSARAVTDTTILRLPAHAFKSMFEKFNESAVKVVQIIMVRLQRVTFSALHNYLGLSKELLKSEGGQGDLKELNIHRLNRQPSTPGSASPSKTVTINPLTTAIAAQSASSRESKISEGDEGELSVKTDSEGHQLTSEESEDKFHTPPMQYNTLPRKSNASMLMGETSDQLSDFDQALMRARVSITDDKSIVLSGSPPRARRWSTDPAGHVASFRSRQLPDESHILSLASKDLVQILGLKDPSLLKDRLTLKKVRAGTIFCKQGDQDTSLFFLVKGSVSVVQNVVGESSKEALMYSVEPGEIIDVLAVLTGEPSFFTMRTKTDAIMVVFSKLDFYQIMRSEPFIVLNVAHQTVKRMSNFVRQIDFALDWQMLEAGKALFRQGDTSDSIFIVLTGRLRSVITSVGGKKELVNEFGRGELVGIVEVLTQTERATTVLAIRDTEVTKIPSELLSLIKLRYPQVVARLIHLLGTRILGSLQNRNNISLQSSVTMDNDTKMERSTVANLATIAIVPVTEDVPLTNFTLELQHALLAIGPTVRLTPDIVRARLGTAALDGVNEFRLFNWLSQQEDIHRMVLYQCDHQLTKWSKHCLRQADCILIVALGDKEPTIGPIERELENIAVRAQKELVLLHREDAETPRNTAEWLNVRGWLSSHHHLRCPKRVLKVKSRAKTLELYERLFDNPPNRMADFSRLARFLTGTSIGLVLGGGGARGLAHVGMIKAMTEEGIPIDMVGGTSMGAFIGALWAEERQYVPFTRRAREWAMGMTSLWKKIWDLTYPMTSMFTGWAFNESIETVFRDRQIEDLWIPYFCITTNISNSSMRVHSLGSVWRYVRASMSLSGYLPPLCDPVDGHLLLDGGYVNNLPADVMHHLGANFVFAVDVGSQDEKDHTNYGDSLSGWWLLWKRWNPWAEPVKVPDMTEIQSRLAYVSCVRQLELVKNSDYCEYIRPPIDRYATLQFGAYDEIMETGFHHGKTLFSTWQKGGLADKLFVEYQGSSTSSQGSVPSKGSMESKNQLRNHVPVMAYFTDLAEQVSKIDKPKSKFFLQDGEEDDVYEEVDDDDDDAGVTMDGYEEDDEFADEDEDIGEEEEEEEEEEEDEEDEDDNDDAVMDGNDESNDNGGGAERRKVILPEFPALSSLEACTLQDDMCANSESKACIGPAQGDGNLEGEISPISGVDKGCSKLSEGEGRYGGFEGSECQIRMVGLGSSGMDHEENSAGLCIEGDGDGDGDGEGDGEGEGERAVGLVGSGIMSKDLHSCISDSFTLDADYTRDNEQNITGAEDVGKSLESLESDGGLALLQPVGNSLSALLQVGGFEGEKGRLENIETLHGDNGGVGLAIRAGEKRNVENKNVESENVEKEKVESENVENANVKDEEDKNENIESDNVESDSMESDNVNNENANSEKNKNGNVESDDVKNENAENENVEDEKDTNENVENGKVGSVTASTCNNINHPVVMEKSSEQDRVKLQKDPKTHNPIIVEENTATKSAAKQHTSDHQNSPSPFLAITENSSNTRNQQTLLKHCSEPRGSAVLNTQSKQNNTHEATGLRDSSAVDNNTCETHDSLGVFKTSNAMVVVDAPSESSPRYVTQEDTSTKLSDTSVSESNCALYAVTDEQHQMSTSNTSDTDGVRASSAPEVSSFGTEWEEVPRALSGQQSSTTGKECSSTIEKLAQQGSTTVKECSNTIEKLAQQGSTTVKDCSNSIDQPVPENCESANVEGIEVQSELSSLKHESISGEEQRQEKLDNKVGETNQCGPIPGCCPSAVASCGTRQDFPMCEEPNCSTPVILTSTEPQKLKLTKEKSHELPRFLSLQYFQQNLPPKIQDTQPKPVLEENNSILKCSHTPGLEKTVVCDEPAADIVSPNSPKASSLPCKLPSEKVCTTEGEPPVRKAPGVNHSITEDKTPRETSVNARTDEKKDKICPVVSCSAPVSPTRSDSQDLTLLNQHSNKVGLQDLSESMSSCPMPTFLSPQYFQEKLMRCSEKLKEHFFAVPDHPSVEFEVMAKVDQQDGKLLKFETSTTSATSAPLSTLVTTSEQSSRGPWPVSKPNDLVSPVDRKPQDWSRDKHNVIQVSQSQSPGKVIKNPMKNPDVLTGHGSQSEIASPEGSPNATSVERICGNRHDGDVLLSQGEIPRDIVAAQSNQVRVIQQDDSNQDKSEETSSWDDLFTQTLTSNSEEVSESRSCEKLSELQEVLTKATLDTGVGHDQEGKNKRFVEKNKRSSFLLEREKKKYYALLLKKLREEYGGAIGTGQDTGRGADCYHKLHEKIQIELKLYLDQKVQRKKELESDSSEVQVALVEQSWDSDTGGVSDESNTSTLRPNSELETTDQHRDSPVAMPKPEGDSCIPECESDPITCIVKSLTEQDREHSTGQGTGGEIKRKTPQDQTCRSIKHEEEQFLKGPIDHLEDMKLNEVDTHLQMFPCVKPPSNTDQASCDLSDMEANEGISHQTNKPLLLSRAEIQRLIFESDSDSDLEIMSSADKQQVLMNYQSSMPRGGRSQPEAHREGSGGKQATIQDCSQDEKKISKPDGADVRSDTPSQEHANSSSASSKGHTATRKESLSRPKRKRKKKKPDQAVDRERQLSEGKSSSVDGPDTAESETIRSSTHSEISRKSAPPKVTPPRTKKGNVSNDSSPSGLERRKDGEMRVQTKVREKSELKPIHSGSERRQSKVKKVFKSVSNDSRCPANSRAVPFEWGKQDIDIAGQHTMKPGPRRGSKVETTPGDGESETQTNWHKLSRRDRWWFQQDGQRESTKNLEKESSKVANKETDLNSDGSALDVEQSQDYVSGGIEEATPNLSSSNKPKGRGGSVVSSSGQKRSHSMGARPRWSKHDTRYAAAESTPTQTPEEARGKPGGAEVSP